MYYLQMKYLYEYERVMNQPVTGIVIQPGTVI